MFAFLIWCVGLYLLFMLAYYAWRFVAELADGYSIWKDAQRAIIAEQKARAGSGAMP